MAWTVQFSLTDIVAWWGAVTGSAVLLWDVYKWKRSGPRLSVSVSSGMNIVGFIGIDSHDLFVTVKVVNVGDRATTLTGLGLLVFRSRLERLLHKHHRSGVVMNPAIGKLPEVLNPGEVWNGAIVQDEVNRYMADGRAYCAVYYSTKKRPVLTLVPPSE